MLMHYYYKYGVGALPREAPGLIAPVAPAIREG